MVCRCPPREHAALIEVLVFCCLLGITVAEAPEPPRASRTHSVEKLCFDVGANSGCKAHVETTVGDGCPLSDAYVANVTDALAFDLTLADGQVAVGRPWCYPAEECRHLREGNCAIYVTISTSAEPRRQEQLRLCQEDAYSNCFRTREYGLFENDETEHDGHESILPWVVISAIVVGLVYMVVFFKWAKMRKGRDRRLDDVQYVDLEVENVSVTSADRERAAKDLEGIPLPFPPPAPAKQDSECEHEPAREKPTAASASNFPPVLPPVLPPGQRASLNKSIDAFAFGGHMPSPTSFRQNVSTQSLGSMLGDDANCSAQRNPTYSPVLQSLQPPKRRVATPRSPLTGSHTTLSPFKPTRVLKM
eukprot:TRINITY_DN22687_c0_g1_i1.p1 TRINITY_DN22687_c0_g1~~TRINITY_DN22687_c0_g1_i1.p1  ORF type:complete len:362 (+),score=33.91 TRINITY_DN22687_c0_g1_i1:36-1121(+)